jgi:Fe-S cluster biogenesis protein NfuA
MAVDRDELDRAVTWVNGRMRSHAGEIAVVDVDDDGAVEVRFGGMCCGCPYKAVTFEGTVRPALAAVEGVREVRAAGTRISDEAAARLAHYLGGDAPRGDSISHIGYDRHESASQGGRAEEER